MEFADNYEHLHNNIMYITENIPTSETEENLNQQILQGCTCENVCTKENDCSCLRNSGSYYQTSKISEEKAVSILNSYKIVLGESNKPSYECNDSCKCYKTVCGNRLVQYGPRKGLQLIECGQKGLGLVTNTQIKSGSFICEYAGEIISESEAFNRYKCLMKVNSMNYIFCINEHFGEATVKTYIDPTNFGNIGRYINHSCDPNCKLTPIRVNSPIPRLCIFAAKDIDKNCELTFDYGDGSLGFDVSRTSVQKICLCGSEVCRKYLPFNIHV